MSGFFIPEGMEVVVGYNDSTRTYHHGDKVLVEPSMRLLGMKWMPGHEPSRKQVSAPIAPGTIYGHAMLYIGLGWLLGRSFGPWGLIAAGPLILWLTALLRRSVAYAKVMVPSAKVPDRPV